jgi:anti-sigma factor RsiW
MTMKCALFHKMIGDRLDGTIRPQDRARLEDHLKSCPECREVAADFQKIAAAARALPQEDPAEELWPAIRAGVAAARRARPVPAFAHPRFRWAWAAGLVFIGVVLGLGIGLRPWKADLPTAFAADQDRTVAKLQEAEKHYQLAIQAMTEALAPGRASLDPRTAALFKRDLQAVDAAIESCRGALRRDPKNLDARVYLLGAYQKKVEVLNGFLEIGKNGPAGMPAGPGL